MATKPKATDLESTPARPSRGIQSIEVGGELLKALVRHGRPMALKDLAASAGLAAARAHPYLVSFSKVGLIEQDNATSHYRLGSLAIEAGLISLQQVDPVRLASDELPALAAEIRCTVSLAVWGDPGPVIVRVEASPSAIHVAMRHGTPASLRHTGTGKVFAAYMAPERLEKALQQEPDGGRESTADFFRELEGIRENRISTVHDELLPGVSAMAVPVFDAFGKLVMAIAAIGPSHLLNLSLEGEQAKALKRLGENVSRKLGHSMTPMAGPL
jgi:DNA-binding IclR family transcriptional regulator